MVTTGRQGEIGLPSTDSLQNEQAPDISDLAIARNGEYRTAERSVSWFASWFPSCSFHSQLVRIVLRSARMAKQGKYDDREWTKSSLEVMHALESVGVQFEVTGLENVSVIDGPCVVAANHMSSLETGILPGLLRPYQPVTFVIKQSLLHYPVFKHIMRSRNPIAVTQSNPRQDLKAMLSEGTERLQQGTSIVVFPEGARRTLFAPTAFNSIAVKLAHRANVPILPLALQTDAWGLGWGVQELGRIDPKKPVRFAFGEPMMVAGRSNGENRVLIDFITEKLLAWGGKVEVPSNQASSE